MKWLRRHLPARPVQGFLDDISCALRALRNTIRPGGGNKVGLDITPEEEEKNKTLASVDTNGPTGTSTEHEGQAPETEGTGEADEGGGQKGQGEGKHQPHQIVWSNDFAKAVRRAGVKVVVLTTCESGWRDHEDFSWRGVAAALLRAGIPVVVGMQFTISDAAAIAFSGAFYRAIARGLSVDEAVGHGRAAMTDQALADLDEGLEAGKVPDPNGVGDNFLSDFGLPVLYTRSPEVQSLEKIRDVDTDPLPMTNRFRDWNPGFGVFVGGGEREARPHSGRDRLSRD